MLNALVARGNDPSHTGAKVSYQRRKEIDYHHTGPSGKVRVTRDAESLQIKPNGVITKSRIADLNVYCPNRAFDYRISINTETPAPEPTSDHSSVREKNRLSYTHQNFNVDLTQVTQPERVSPSQNWSPHSPLLCPATDLRLSLSQPHEPIHELEVEFKDVDALMQAAQQAREQQPSNGAGSANAQDWTPFDDQVLIFLNNIRLLIRYVAMLFLTERPVAFLCPRRLTLLTT